ncbi:ABC transporter permease [Agromyces endophyticus]|uniref:ABC transporter permease n=1 Tax=Agromyces sp. H17E-10 TaxID=2932244 RepID=UPI001FD474C4|nr:ABC transporter permease [Agromyces sp. H17E-10]UOQ88337.1 ABC transporter permease [Agromyces sp. H17E-10]
MSTRHHSSLSTTGLLRRQFFAAPFAAVMLALLVAGGAFLATALPRAVAAMHTTALSQHLEDFPARTLDVVSSNRSNLPDLGPSSGGTTLPDDIDAVWGQQEEYLLDARERMEPELRRVTDDPLSVVIAGPSDTKKPGAGLGSASYVLNTGFDPRLEEHVELTSGEWPSPLEALAPQEEPPVEGGDPGTGTVEIPTPVTTDEPLEIVATEAFAESMEWEVGQVREMPAGAASQPVELVGTFAPIDPDDGFWSHLPVPLEPSVAFSADGSLRVTGFAFAHPNSWPALESAQLPSTVELWYPVATDRVRADRSQELRTDLDEFTSVGYMMGDGQWPPGQYFRTVGMVAFGSGLGDALDDAAQAADTSDAVLATIASGPIGVVVAVLVLGARVVFERRRTGLELAAARGASDSQLRGALAIEGLVIGLPAAAIGSVLGALAVPADGGTVGWYIAALFALTPMVLLVASAPALSPLRRARADFAPRSGGRFRWVVETLVAIVAVAAVVLLLRRGLTTAAGAVGVDPLLAAVPLLLSLAACLVVLRLYPIPLAGIVRSTSRRSGLVAFLGSARALRDPSAGVVPVLTVVVGISVAMFSATLLGTVQAGVDRAADARVGADVSVNGGPFTLDQQSAFAEVPGVEATAPVYATTPVQVSIDGRLRTTTLIVIDTEEMRRVQAGREDAVPLPEALASTDGDEVPVIISQVIADSIDDADQVEINRDDFSVLGVVDGRTPFMSRSSWVLMDKANAERFVSTFVPETVLVRTEPGADVDQVVDDLQAIAGTESTVTTPETVRAELGAGATTQGLVVALIGAIVLTGLLTALAIVLTLVVGRGARERLLPLLATLGLRRRGERALVAWEIGPVVVAALVAGVALGVALPFIVLQGIDLRTFTGGDAQPAVVFDPVLIGTVLVASLAVTALAVLVASRTGGEASAARAMRKEEEG